MIHKNQLNKLPSKKITPNHVDSKITYMYIMGAIMSMGGLVWGLLCITFEIYIASAIPFSYILFTALNFLLYKKKKNFGFASSFQVLISILLPFMMQWYLGGFLMSGAVMMWSILAVLGSLSFQPIRYSTLWIYLFLFLTIVSSFVNIKNIESLSHQTIFLIINISFIFVAIYYLVVYLIRVRENANQVLKEKNDLITESIDYARVIQESIVPKENEFKKIIPDSFIFYQPKDIISGDFYYAKKLNENQFHLVVADCSGQGVSGAFISLLGINIFNQVIPDNHWLAPNLIFDRFRDEMLGIFKSNITPVSGIDACIVSVNRQKKLLFFTGAKSSLILVRNNSSVPLIVNLEHHKPFLKSENGIVYIIEGDKQSIGKSNDTMNPFSRNQIEYLPGDQVFLSSDGLFNQYCESNEKIFSLKRFCELIINFSETQSADSKKNLIEHSLDNWQGKNEQTDDICVVGFTL